MTTTPPISVHVSPVAPQHMHDLAAIFAQLVALAERGEYTGDLQIHMNRGKPSGLHFGGHTSARSGWRFPILGVEDERG